MLLCVAACCRVLQGLPRRISNAYICMYQFFCVAGCCSVRQCISSGSFLLRRFPMKYKPYEIHEILIYRYTYTYVHLSKELYPIHQMNPIKYKKYSSIGTYLHLYQFMLRRFHVHALYRYICIFIKRALSNTPNESDEIQEILVYQMHIYICTSFGGGASTPMYCTVTNVNLSKEPSLIHQKSPI